MGGTRVRARRARARGPRVRSPARVLPRVFCAPARVRLPGTFGPAEGVSATLDAIPHLEPCQDTISNAKTQYRYMLVSAPRFLDIVSQILSFDIWYDSDIEIQYRSFCLRYRI